jgi:hypothetical protein
MLSETILLINRTDAEPLARDRKMLGFGFRVMLYSAFDRYEKCGRSPVDIVRSIAKYEDLPSISVARHRESQSRLTIA